MSIEKYFNDDDYSNATGYTEAELVSKIRTAKDRLLVVTAENDSARIWYDEANARKCSGKRPYHSACDTKEAHKNTSFAIRENTLAEMKRIYANIPVWQEELDGLIEARLIAEENKRISDEAKAEAKRQADEDKRLVSGNSPMTKPSTSGKPVVIGGSESDIKMNYGNRTAMENHNSIEEPKKGLSKKVMVIGAGVLVLGLVVFLIFRNRKNG